MSKKIKNLFFCAPEKLLLTINIIFLPLVFCTSFQNILDFPKREAFLFFTLLAFLFWLARGILKKEIKIKFNPIFFASCGLLVVFLISSSLSFYKASSFLGLVFNSTDNFLSFFVLILSTFLISQIFKKEDISKVLKVFVFSVAFAVLVGILQIFNVFILPVSSTKLSSFNLLGRVSLGGLVSAIFLPLSLALLFSEKTKRNKVFLGIASLIFLFALILYDFKLAWIELFVFSVILSIFATRSLFTKKEIVWTIILSLLLIISVFFFFFAPKLTFLPSIPNEVSPGFGTETDVLRGVYNESTKNIVFGVGPGNFVYGYNKYHSPVINQTIFWNTRFLSGDSTFFDWLITKGVIGGITLLLFYFVVIWRAIKVIRNYLQKEELRIVVGVAGALIVLIIGTFFYSYNFFLWAVFWTLLGVFLVFDRTKTKTFSFRSSLSQGIGVTLCVVILALVVICLFVEAKNCLAEVNYLKGANSRLPKDSIEYYRKATRLNPNNDLYWRSLAQVYLLRANKVSQDKNISQQEKTSLVNDLIQGGTGAFEKALKLNYFNPANWNARGYFYRNLIGIPGAGELALASYRKAIDLEPASPFAYSEMARTYILIAQDFVRQNKKDSQKEALKLALVQLNKAIGLKRNYAPAYYLMAVVYDQQGNTEEALNKLEETKKYAPKDAGVLFQTGMLYWRIKQYDKAKENFEQAVNLKPDYSNALYMLGLVYDAKNQKEKAIEVFKKVLDLNPENGEVKKILGNLKSGKPALEGIVIPHKSLQEGTLQIEKSKTNLQP
ncbi:tetratricopeptide repeat protein [bacterium]|nr:tetratricopeptide repeat protein [bacterium]